MSTLRNSRRPPKTPAGVSDGSGASSDASASANRSAGTAAISECLVLLTSWHQAAAAVFAAARSMDDAAPQARVHVAGGLWLTLDAARLSAGAAIAVTMRPSTPRERAAPFAAAHGLTSRETALVHLLLTGDDTRHLARALGVSGYTV